MATVPNTVAFPRELQARRRSTHWDVEVDDTTVSLSNLDKPYWKPEGFLKGDLVTYYFNIAPTLLPYLRDRPLTLKRMPEGADGDFFYEKQVPAHAPPWVRTVPIRSRDGQGDNTSRTINYVVANDTRTLLWLAGLGAIECHPWHSRSDDLGHPDYALFDLDPMQVDFATVREVALLVKTVLDQLDLRGYPRTSGATGIQVYVPLERVHSAARIREWVARVCRLINRADPDRTTMEFSIADRSGKVYLDHAMNTEGRNIASVYSVRPERGATVSAPLTWDELSTDVQPGDFTIASIWSRLDAVGDLFTPLLAGGQDLRHAMEAVGMPAHSEQDDQRSHDVTQRLTTYDTKRRFDVTPEPRGRRSEGAHALQLQPDIESEPDPGTPPDSAGRFVIQHHLATRLHHDLRLAHEGTAPSWALPKGLPEVPGLRHLAVQTEDHPVEYLDFQGEIPHGEYGAGPMRIWDQGSYELLEWSDDKVSVRLHGTRHRGEWHLFRIGGADQPKVWNVIRADRPSPEQLRVTPPTFEPMLATLRDDPFDDPSWLYEVKWDGVRAIATVQRPGQGDDGRTQLVSRQGNDISAGYPELASLWERVLAVGAVLDGEIVAFDADGNPRFQLLQQRMHVRGNALDRLRRTIPVRYVAFDLLWLEGVDLTPRPLVERLALLDSILIPGGPLERSEPVSEHGVALYEAAQQRGLEGVMAKRADSRYTPGRRSPAWRKIKVP